MLGPRRCRINRRSSLRMVEGQRNLAKTSPAVLRSTTIMRLVLLLFTMLLSVGAVHAQSLEEIDRRQAAMIEAWEKTPLTIRRALFITGEPRGFGLYQER